MPLLTELLGAEVVDTSGRRAGRLADMVVAPDPDHPPVVGVVLRGERIVRRVAEGVDPAGLVVGEGEAQDGLWLVRDVLDTQVYDVAGLCVSRVGDVVLEISDGVVVLSGVEAGLAPVLRRLGLVAAPRRVRPRTVSWSDLHPLSKRGHSLVLAADPQRAQERIEAAHAHRPHLLHRHADRQSR
jgi:sporulation protein YlmC with PRC-barrel domain